LRGKGLGKARARVGGWARGGGWGGPALACGLPGGSGKGYLAVIGAGDMSLH